MRQPLFVHFSMSIPPRRMCDPPLNRAQVIERGSPALPMGWRTKEFSFRGKRQFTAKRSVISSERNLPAHDAEDVVFNCFESAP